MNIQRRAGPPCAPMAACARQPHHALRGAVHIALRAWFFSPLPWIDRVEMADGAGPARATHQAAVLPAAGAWSRHAVRRG
jgi:hypothetical protein